MESYLLRNMKYDMIICDYHIILWSSKDMIPDI